RVAFCSGLSESITRVTSRATSIVMARVTSAEGVPEFGAIMRAPLWFVMLLILAAIGVGVYAYFTTPLPLGLGALIRTPAGDAAGTPVPTVSAIVAAARASAGQPLVL